MLNNIFYHNNIERENMETTFDIVKELSEARSNTGATTLVTLYVPGNTNLSLVSSQISTELSTSQNIKNKNVRDSVYSALKSGQQKIKSYNGHRSPENGFVLCAGEIKSCV